MNRPRDEDHEYQWADDAKLAGYTPEEWARQVAVSRGFIERSEQALKKDEGRDHASPNPASGDHQKPRSLLRSMDPLDADNARIEAVHRRQAAILRRTSPVADTVKTRALIAVDRETS